MKAILHLQPLHQRARPAGRAVTCRPRHAAAAVSRPCRRPDARPAVYRGRARCVTARRPGPAARPRRRRNGPALRPAPLGAGQASTTAPACPAPSRRRATSAPTCRSDPLRGARAERRGRLGRGRLRQQPATPTQGRAGPRLPIARRSRRMRVIRRSSAPPEQHPLRPLEADPGLAPALIPARPAPTTNGDQVSYRHGLRCHFRSCYATSSRAQQE